MKFFRNLNPMSFFRNQNGFVETLIVLAAMTVVGGGILYLQSGYPAPGGCSRTMCPIDPLFVMGDYHFDKDPNYKYAWLRAPEGEWQVVHQPDLCEYLTNNPERLKWVNDHFNHNPEFVIPGEQSQ